MGFDTYIGSIRKDMLAFLDTLNFNDILEKEPTLIVHWEQINYQINVHIEYNLDGSANNLEICPYTRVSTIEGLILPDSLGQVIEMISGSILDGFDEYIRKKPYKIERLNNEMWKVYKEV